MKVLFAHADWGGCGHYRMFVKDVAKGRGASVSDVKGGFGQGRVETAKRAVDSGLADKVEPIGATLLRVSEGSGSSTRTRSLGVQDDEMETHAEAEPGKVVYTEDELRAIVDTLASA